MTMSRYFVCCEQCFETIGKKSTKAAKLWMDFCALGLQESEIVVIENNDFPELRVLENLGFVVTTDRYRAIAVRVIGHGITEDGEHFFCRKGGRHE